MKDGTIILFNEIFSKNWLIKLIYVVTRSWIYHVAIYFHGKIYECGLVFRNGKLKHQVLDDLPLENVKGCIIQIPAIEMNEFEKNKMYNFFIDTKNKRYFVIKLILMFLIFPFRHIFDLIKWYPMKNKMFICSEFVDKAWKTAGRNLFNKFGEDFTAPCDFEKIDGFNKAIYRGE
jgi:hypothetical protein